MIRVFKPHPDPSSSNVKTMGGRVRPSISLYSKNIPAQIDLTNNNFFFKNVLQSIKRGKINSTPRIWHKYNHLCISMWHEEHACVAWVICLMLHEKHVCVTWVLCLWDKRFESLQQSIPDHVFKKVLSEKFLFQFILSNS